MKSILTIIFSFLLVVSGLSQTRNVVVDTNGVVVQPTNIWTANATNARSGLGLGSAATNPASAFQPSSTILSNISSSNIVTITSGGTGATNAATARTNLGLGTNANVTFDTLNLSSILKFVENSGILVSGSSGVGLYNFLSFKTNAIQTYVPFQFLTNFNNSAAITRTNLGLGAIWLTNTNVTNFKTEIGLGVSDDVYFQGATLNFLTVNEDAFLNYAELNSGTNSVQLSGSGIVFIGNSSITTRTNLGLGWSALTNSNAGTGLVSVNTNGEVVSPTNFWQVAPITTTFIETKPTTNSSTNIVASRFLHIHSLATNIINVTNTIVLPTNGSTFEGDLATIVHKGSTNSTTQIRQVGSTNNIITLNKFNEAVELTFYNNNWQLFETRAFVDPIYFSGTNTASVVAASRTNLGLGATNTPEFRGITSSGNIIITNQSSTNNGLLFIYRTNSESFLGLANLIASNNTAVNNETLFRVGIAEATNKAAQFGFRSTNTNGSGVAVFSTFGYNALMMIGPSDRSQTNAAIEADIYSISPTNKVVTLIDTNTGAFSLHRPIGFRTNETNASPISGGNFSDRVRWLEIYIGTNTFYVPLFQ